MTQTNTRAHLRASNLRAELQHVQQRSTGDAGHRGRCSRSQQQVHCTSANRISVGERRGGEGRRLKVSYTKLVQQHDHRDNDEYRCYTGNMHIIDVIIIIAMTLVSIILKSLSIFILRILIHFKI